MLPHRVFLSSIERKWKPEDTHLGYCCALLRACGNCWTPNPKWVSVEVEWTKAVQETFGCESQWSHKLL